MARISTRTIDAITAAIDLVSLVSEYTHLERKGSDWWGCCPFHHEKTPSFHVVPDKKMYYCFGCGAGGSTIKFLMEIEKLSFNEASLRLAQKAGISIVHDEEGNDDQVEYRQNLRSLYEKIAASFHHLLLNNEEASTARQYLKDRGISLESIKQFQLGYTPQNRYWLYTFLQKKGYSHDFLADSGLFSKKQVQRAFFAQRIMFPICDRHGQVIAFGGRALKDGEPKYLNSSESIQFKKGETLFALHHALPEIRRQKKVIICEGYMDVIAYHQAGIRYAVAPLGTALTEMQVKLLSSFAHTIMLSFDGDDAGKNASYKAILLARSLECDVQVIPLVGGKDPADIVCKFGSDGLHKLVKSATIDFDYLISIAKERFDMSNPQGKANVATFLFDYIRQLRSDVHRENVFDRLAQILGVSVSALHSDYHKKQPLSVEVQTSNQRVAPQHQLHHTAQLRILLAACTHPTLFAMLRNELHASHFTDPLAKELFIVLEECFREGSSTYDSLLDHCTDETVKKVVTESIIKGEFAENADKVVADGILLMKYQKLLEKKNNILGRLRQYSFAASSEEISAMHELMQEKQSIDEQLRTIKGKNR